MSTRKIKFDPTDLFDFKTDASYRELWAFLPDKDRVKIIAQQLAFLSFHDWLRINLKTIDATVPKTPTSLYSAPAEGFLKVDVLLYASICEAALYTVLEKYSASLASPPPALKNCFYRNESVVTDFHNSPISAEFSGKSIKGRLAIVHGKETKRSAGDIHFVDLIAAGCACGIFKSALRDSLDKLRDMRNAVHLARHLVMKDANKGFTAASLGLAKRTTEELRKAIQQFVGKHNLT